MQSAFQGSNQTPSRLAGTGLGVGIERLAGTGVGVGAEVRQGPPTTVGELLVAIDEEIAKLHEAISNLEDSIGPILSDRPPAGESVASNPPAPVRVIDHQMQHGRLLTAAVSRLKMIRDRVQL